MKSKVRKYKVKHAKLASWIMLITTIILGFLMFNFLENNMEQGSTDIAIIVFRYVLSFFVSVASYLVFLIDMWSELTNRRDKYKGIRFLYHYNKCVEAFGNMDVNKVKYIYENRLKDVSITNTPLTPLKDRIKFGYSVMTCNSSDELLKPAPKFQED